MTALHSSAVVHGTDLPLLGKYVIIQKEVLGVGGIMLKHLKALKAVSATAMHQFKTHPPILLIFVL